MKESYIEEDEIDLKELVKTLWARKVFILIFTSLMTIVGAIYAFSKAPTIKGYVILEVGYTTSTTNTTTFIENPNYLINKLNIEDI